MFPIVLAAVLALAPAPQRSSRATVGVQNALLVILDDVSVEDLEEAQTPVIDELALNGCTFTQAFANPVCSPTRRCLLFGKWRFLNSGADCSNDISLVPALGETSLAELVPGVRSILAGKWHLGGNPTGGSWRCAPMGHGFEAWHGGVPANVYSCGPGGYFNWPRIEDCIETNETAYHPQVSTDALRAWWQGTPGRKLGVLSLNLAHFPFHTPPAELLPEDYPLPVPGDRRARFEAMIVAYDTLLGQVMEVVDRDETLVVVVGDNGTPPGVAPDPARAKFTIFERGIHVPLIVSSGRFARRTSSELVHVVDVYATIADYMGGPNLGDGISLRGALRGAPFKGHEFVLCGKNDQIAVRSARYKLARYVLPDGGRGGEELFFDLLTDPGESVNRIDDPSLAAVVANHRSWLDAHRP